MTGREGGKTIRCLTIHRRASARMFVQGLGSAADVEASAVLRSPFFYRHRLKRNAS